MTFDEIIDLDEFPEYKLKSFRVLFVDEIYSNEDESLEHLFGVEVLYNHFEDCWEYYNIKYVAKNGEIEYTREFDFGVVDFGVVDFGVVDFESVYISDTKAPLLPVWELIS